MCEWCVYTLEGAKKNNLFILCDCLFNVPKFLGSGQHRLVTLLSHHSNSFFHITYIFIYSLFTSFFSLVVQRYRELMHSLKPPLVPYIGVALSDLTFAEDGNPDAVYLLQSPIYNTRTRPHAHTHIHMHTYTKTCMHTYALMHARCAHTHSHTHTLTHSRTIALSRTCTHWHAHTYTGLYFFSKQRVLFERHQPPAAA